MAFKMTGPSGFKHTYNAIVKDGNPPKREEKLHSFKWEGHSHNGIGEDLDPKETHTKPKNKSESPMNKTKEDRIRGRKGGTTASVTNRLNEGNTKGARLARRTSVASSKGKKAKAKRLQRKVDDQDSKFFKDQVRAKKANE